MSCGEGSRLIRKWLSSAWGLVLVSETSSEILDEKALVVCGEGECRVQDVLGTVVFGDGGNGRLA